MREDGTRKLILGGLFVALGIVLPMAFHSVGAGPVFLPMHIPVLLAGCITGPAVGVLVGAVTPILSSLLTGMPSLMPPVAQMMVVELAIYGLLSGLTYKTWKLHIVVSLIIAMFGGRIIYGILRAFVLPLYGFSPIPVFYPITAGLVAGLPGIVIQLVLIPPVVIFLERQLGVERSTSNRRR
ncbi:MAG: ECF transporter S component [Bacillota bacterium]|jgi:riboflavin transporter FmnP|nr:ECF transporter S component [Bacillota bacterium]MDI9415967.1 ECF transporter S component [Bacillota bacterium]NLD12941.1 ECF transporter S component [Bacillota bacterium]HCD41112.1 ECF transporter S component [Bacillota bacterium]HOB89396.1 ECF transporter S component [Bacillota bacterium]